MHYKSFFVFRCAQQVTSDSKDIILMYSLTKAAGLSFIFTRYIGWAKPFVFIHMIMFMKDFPDLNQISPLPSLLQTSESNLSQFLFICRSWESRSHGNSSWMITPTSFSLSDASNTTPFLRYLYFLNYSFQYLLPCI